MVRSSLSNDSNKTLLFYINITAFHEFFKEKLKLKKPSRTM